MKHRDAEVLLDEFASEDLDGPQARGLAAHVADCRDCSDWLAAYQRIELEARLHPTSDLLANYAVEPAAIGRELRHLLESHLSRCNSCGREYRLTRHALEQARPDAGVATAGSGRTFVDVGWKIAAGIAVATVLTTLLIVGSRSLGEEENVVSNQSIENSRTVEASERLVAEKIAVHEAATLTLRAKGSVILGDGFSVKRGGRLVVSTGKAANES